MTLTRAITCALALALPAAAFAQAQSATPPAKSKSTTPSSTKSASDQPKTVQKHTLTEAEQRVLYDLNKLDHGEVAVGQLAATNASSADVKGYAQHIVTDHKRHQEKVMALAKSHNVQLSALTPTNTQEAKAKKEEALLARLKALRGKEFDQQYTQAMIDGHQSAIADVQQAMASCEDAELHTLLEDTMPALKQHLQKAQTLANAKLPVAPSPTPAPSPMQTPTPMP